jgi:hypothetical protein
MTQLTHRLRVAWAALDRDQRLAAFAAIGLIVSMFLPWYSTSDDGQSYSAFGVWSFVEASILLVAIGVLALLFARGERRAFHLPGGDGVVLMAAGGWCMFLDFYRQLDKPNIDPSHGTVGVSWGIFIAFLFGAMLAYAGWRIARRHAAEPVVDGDDPRTARIEGDRSSVATPPDPRDAGALGEPVEPGPRGDDGSLGEPREAAPPDTATAERPPVEPATSAGRRRRSGPRRPDGQFEGQMSFDDNDAPDAPRG